MRGRPKYHVVRFVDDTPPTHHWAMQRKMTCTTPLPQLIQGRNIVQNALIASVPRTRPKVWVSYERIRQAGMRLDALSLYPVNLSLIKLPFRLYWSIRERTPAWEAMLRQRRRDRLARKQAERARLETAPPLDYTITLPGGHP